MKKVVLIAGLSLAAFAAHADMHPETNWLFELGLATGGDTLVEVDVVTSGRYSVEDVDAGEGLNLGFGPEFYLGPNWGAAATIGYKTGGVFADNGDVDFSRFPLTAMAFYDFQRVRVGAGLTYEMDPELDLSGIGYGGVDFENATGLVLQADWLISPSFSLGLRHTTIDYEVDGYNGKVDGDNIGLQFKFSF